MPVRYFLYRFAEVHEKPSQQLQGLKLSPLPCIVSDSKSPETDDIAGSFTTETKRFEDPSSCCNKASALSAIDPRLSEFRGWHTQVCFRFIGCLSIFANLRK